MANAVAVSDSGLFSTPIKESQLDARVFSEFADGKERAVGEDLGKKGPKAAIVTKTSFPFFIGARFGATKTPGVRHLRIGFTEPMPVGTLLVMGDVTVSVLKPDADYPGRLDDDSQWIPAQRVDGNGQPDSDTIVAWLVPQGTTTRALRFTHESSPLEQTYEGSLRGVQILAERMINIAPLAVPFGRVSKEVSRINNNKYDSWRAWENLSPSEGDRSRVVADDPEWLILTWPKPMEMNGVALVWAGFGSGEIQAYVGPDGAAPGEASDKDWETVGELPGITTHYPTTFAPYWVDFGKRITARALRLRITTVSGEAFAKDRHRNGKRVWLGEWLALSAVGDASTEAIRAALAKGRDKAEAEGVFPIRFSLPEAGFVTLVIDDADGVRVRNLVSETPFSAGEHTVWWDGSGDLGRDVKAAEKGVYHIPYQPVAPGEYRVHGLWRRQVKTSYEFSVYAPGNPPWSTEDHTGGWLANHSAPQAVAFVPGGVRSPTRESVIYLGSPVTEGPDAVAWVDLDGRKRGGRKWIGGTWTGAAFLSYDAGGKADPNVSVYAGIGWKDEKVENSSLIRLNTLTPSGDSKPVMNVDLGSLPVGTKMTEALSGLAARDSTLVCSLIHLNELLLVDATPGSPAKVGARVPLESPRGSVFDSMGRLLVLSGTKVVRYPGIPSAGATSQPLVEKGLEDPRAITLDANGNLYVSDWGTSHQVKVFSAEGKFLRAIGVPGTPRAGPYNANHLNHPWGLAVDSKNQLWVAEHDQLPRRVSVWTLDGKLQKAFYGPAKYGGGGVIDPQDKTRFFYAEEQHGAMEFLLDWEKGTSELVSVYYRPGAGAGLELPRQANAPEQPIYFQGRRYFTNCFNSSPTSGTEAAFLFLERDGVAQPVAAMGWAFWWDILKEERFQARWPQGVKLNGKGELPMTTFFQWSDTNGDGKVQPEEVLMQERESFGVTILPDLSFCVANFGGRHPKTLGETVRFFPTGFDERGVPSYDLSQGKVLARDVKPSASSGGSQALTDESGWSVITLGIGPFDARSLSGTKDGKARWSYPSVWPGLHAGQGAPPHSLPGQVIGSTRLLGGFFDVGGETLWAVNSDQGGPYVFTRDGLFVATLFDDVRLGKAWRMPVAERGMDLKGVTLSQENFWPTLTHASDGKAWMIDGTRNAIVRLDGLDSIKRLDLGKIDVTAQRLVSAGEWMQSREVARQHQYGSGVLKVVMTDVAPVVDGRLDDWASHEWVEIDRRGRENIQASVAVASDRLYVAWKTGDGRLLTNTGEDLKALFKTGGALDLMIGTNAGADPNRTQPVPGDLRLLVTQVKGKTKAMLYRAVVPGSPDSEKVPFSSPLRTLYFDQVAEVSEQVQLASGKDGEFEISVPLSVLGLVPAPGMRLRGDVGILRGDAGVTTSRLYWSNKATAMVSDVPSEVQLAPSLWGPWEFVSP